MAANPHLRPRGHWDRPHTHDTPCSECKEMIIEETSLCWYCHVFHTFPLRTRISEPADFFRYFRNPCISGPFIGESTALTELFRSSCRAMCLSKLSDGRLRNKWETISCPIQCKRKERYLIWSMLNTYVHQHIRVSGTVLKLIISIMLKDLRHARKVKFIAFFLFSYLAFTEIILHRSWLTLINRWLRGLIVVDSSCVDQ